MPAAFAQIDEIIVQARKREESIQSVPIAVTAFDRKFIEGAYIETIDDVDRYLPNVSLGDNQFGSKSLSASIRGVGFADVEKTFEPTVLVSIDGVPLGNATGAVIDIFDIEQIEVLRGPQGTLHGRNSIGGSINIRRTRPTGEWGVRARFRYGRYDEKEGGAVINLPKIGQVSAKFNLFVDNDDLFIDNVDSFIDVNENEGQDLIQYGGAVLWEPSENFEALISWNVLNDDSKLVPGVNLSTDRELTCSATITTGAQGCATTSIDAVRASGFTQHFSSFFHESAIDGWDVTAELNWDVDDFTITSITGFRESDETLFETPIGGPAVDLGDPAFISALQSVSVLGFLLPTVPPGTLFPIYVVNREQVYEQFSQEVRLTSNFDGPFNFVTGGYYLTTEYQITGGPSPDPSITGPRITQAYLFGIPVSNRITGQDLTSYAFFAEGTYDITERLKFTGGFRLTYEEKEIDNNFIGNQRVIESEGWFAPTGRAILDYSFTDDLMAYVSWSRGFRSGGWNGRVAVPGAVGPYDPETFDSFELGLRSEWFGNRLRVNPTFFYGIWNDKQQEILGSIPGGGTSTTVLNAASANVKGFELETIAQVTENLNAQFSLGHVSFEFDEFLILGTDFADTAVVANAPEWTIAVGGDYTKQTQWGDLVFRLNYKWVSENLSQGRSTRADPRTVREADGDLDLSLTLERQYNDVGVSLTAFGKDIAESDKGYLASASIAGTLFGFGTIQPTKIWGVELTVDY